MEDLNCAFITSYERDNETNLDYAKARMYNKNLGRFNSVDPVLIFKLTLSPQLWNKYSYTINNPLTMVDGTGEFPISIHVRSFAPYDWFGGGVFKGDGANRGFTVSSDATSKIRAETYYETTTRKSNSSAFGSLSTFKVGPIEDSVFSSAYIRIPKPGEISADLGIDRNSSISNSGNINYHLFGNVKAGPGRVFSWNIDVHTKLSVSTSQFNTTTQHLTITGTVYGDRFPAAEAFVQDSAGNSVFLGVYSVKSLANPVTTLAGDSARPMIHANVTIVTNNNGVFQGVIQNGKQISIEEWNKQFTTQKPAN